MDERKRTRRTPKKGAASNWKQPFLEHLAKTASIVEACRLSGIGRTTVYKYRDQDSDFAQAMSDAIEEAIEDLELEARRRALEGCEKPVFHQGKVCGKIKEYSDTLMIFLLKAHRPEKYRERHDIQHSGSVKQEHAIDLGKLTEENLQDLERILRTLSRGSTDGESPA